MGLFNIIGTINFSHYRHGILEALGFNIFFFKSVFDFIFKNEAYVPLNDAFKSIAVCFSLLSSHLLVFTSLSIGSVHTLGSCRGVGGTLYDSGTIGAAIDSVRMFSFSLGSFGNGDSSKTNKLRHKNV